MARVAINDVIQQFFDGSSIDLIHFIEQQVAKLVKE